METLKDRLSEVMKELHLSKAKDLAIFCDVSEGLVTQWFSGQTKLGPKPLKAFARTHFNIDWIADGTLPKYRPQDTEEEYGHSTQYHKVIVAEQNHPDFVDVRRVTLKLSAGISGVSFDQQHDEGPPLTFNRVWFDKNGYTPRKLIALTVKGESMEPSLHDGDVIVINTADCKPIDGEVYAINYEGEAVVKRLVRDIGKWWLVSDNTDQRKYSRKICQGNDCIIVGRVIHKQSDRI
ncbi:S24 family peptidase [Undibacterium sp. Ji50W]|uniref:S24 family peptidase n=1 Tax=Undibacterium sp. Ji50W TaxID=3413041 RepID=UPI003BF22B4A